MYHVYVDGFLKTTVRATDKTRALVEGVDRSVLWLLLFSTAMFCAAQSRTGSVCAR